MSEEPDFLIQKITKVPRDEVLRFEDIHPEHGAWTWFVRECLTRYTSLYDETPTDLIDQIVESLWESQQKKVRNRNDEE